MIVVECFFRRESVVRKYWARSVRGVVGGQADVSGVVILLLRLGVDTHHA